MRRGVSSRATTYALPFPPTLDRVFTTADTLRVHVEGSVGAAVAAPSASIDVLDAGGKIVRSPSLSLNAGQLIRMDAVVPLAGLPSGVYIFRVTVTSGPEKATRETGFAVR